MLLMIDNYDSFTFNLVQYLGELGQPVKVVRNDALDIAGIVLRELAGEIPVFGVCLGHQAIGQVFGGKVIRAKQIMHGKTSPVIHRGEGVFAGLPNPLEATRYHSLVVEQASLPECLEITAWTENPDGSIDEIMGLRHRTLAVEGVQFHPESILTQHGHDLLRNFLQQALRVAA